MLLHYPWLSWIYNRNPVLDSLLTAIKLLRFLWRRSDADYSADEEEKSSNVS